MGVVEVRGVSYHMHDKLRGKWDSLKDGRLAKIDEDRFYIVDGQEGAGKSLFTIQQASYIDPTILDDEDGKVLPRICFSAEEFLTAIRNTKSTDTYTKCIIFDEAFRGMSSKGALSQTNKKVVQALMEMRQNNLVVFLVSPSFYLLELYAAMMRSKALFHVVKQKGGTRRWVRVFNFKNKAKLYQIGIRKGWGYPLLTKERYSFFNKYPGGDEFEKKYRNKKSETFKEEETRVDKKHKWELQRDKLLEIALEQGMTQQKIEDALKEKGADLSRSQISKIVNKKWE